MAPEGENNLRFEIGHVLFIDLVGYSKLLIEEQKERLRQLTDIVLATSQVAKSTNEQLVRLPTGDGMALVFRNSSEEPARCALEIAEALKKRPEVRVRMGIHSGPVSEVTDVNGRTNIAGAGINMAQRVMDCGDAGHILLSQRVADDLAQYRQWAPLLHDLGECEVKHGVRLHAFNLCSEELGNPARPERFKKPRGAQGSAAKKPRVGTKAGEARSRAAQQPTAVRWIAMIVLILVLTGGAVWLLRLRRQGREKAVAPLSAPEKSIAVLPFENLSSEKENAYFADGIQDEILTRLSKIADLRVVSRTSTEHYKSAPENLPEIARQLGVANILEGSVQRSGDAVRVNVQLIKAANDSHLWADTFDRKLIDIFSVESEVAKGIADQLQAKLTGPEERVISAKPTNNPEAYDAYLRGLAYTRKASFAPANSGKAQQYLKEAVSLDPKFALAWALLANVDADGYISTFMHPTMALREETRRAADTALALQPNLGEAILAKGHYYYACLKDYDTAEHYFEQARQLLPNSSETSRLLAYVTRRRGRWDRSEGYFNEAERLDPRNPSLASEHAFSYIHQARFNEAQRKIDQILDILPDDLDTLATKGAIAQAEGDLPRASTILGSLHPTPSNPIPIERQAYQAILERRPTPSIPRLKEFLAQPDPALGYFNGELRFWLGWAQDIGGDHEAARETWREARGELEHFLDEQPENHFLIGDLALTNLGLGDKATAIALAEHCLVVNPVEQDAIAGPRSLEIIARVMAGAGEPDRAIGALQRLLAMPCSGFLSRSMPLTPALLRLDPMFDPLRNDPRFQKLCEEKEP